MSCNWKTSHAPISTASRFSMPSVELSSGTVEALKWIAVVLMTLDHVNRFLLHDSLNSLYALGRLALPIFAFTLAYHLAQPGAFSSGIHLRVIRRLALFAFISSIPYIALNHSIHGWWPLNILFALLLGTGLVALLESNIRHRKALAFLLFIVGGSIVEYWWAGLATFFFFWRYIKKPNFIDFSGLIFSLFLLGNINGNQWALASLVVIISALNIRLNIPRIKHILYIYYPFHLACIWAITRFSAAS